MTKRIAFTPTGAQAHLIEAYRNAYGLDKPQDVLCAALAQLQKAEAVRAYNRLARQMRADSSPKQETAEARKELVADEEVGRENEVCPLGSSLPRSPNGSTE